MSTSQLLKWYGLRLLAVAFVIGFLSTSTASLVAYIAGTGVLDQHGAVAAFSISYLVIGTIFSTFVHFFIGAVASVFGFMGFSLYRGSRKNRDDVGTPTPTAGGDAALKAFGKKFVIVVLSLAALFSLWQSIGLYVLLSAVSQLAGLIVLTSVMSFILSFLYGTAVIGFIGGIACIMLAFVVSLCSNRSNSATK